MTKAYIVGQKLKLSLMSIIDDHGQSQKQPQDGSKSQSQGIPKMGAIVVDAIERVGLELQRIAWKAINKNTNRCCEDK